LPSQSEVIAKNAYEVINIKYTEPELVLRQRTVGKSDYEGQFITYENLNEFNRNPKNIFDTKPYVDFDKLLDRAQQKELKEQMAGISAVELDSSKVSVKLLTDGKLEELKNSSKGFYSFSIIAFPLIQRGKSGIDYAIVFETKGIIPFAEDVGMQLHFYRKVEGSWEYFCVANIGM